MVVLEAIDNCRARRFIEQRGKHEKAAHADEGGIPVRITPDMLPHVISKAWFRGARIRMKRCRKKQQNNNHAGGVKAA